MSIWIFIVILAAYIIVTYLMRSGWLFGALLKTRTLHELIDRNQRGEDAAVLIDVRSPVEYRGGHIPTAINIPHTEIRVNPPNVPRDTRLVIYCQTGTRSLFAKNALRAAGFNNVENYGRIGRWDDEIVEGDDPGGA